jgi:hypothetical protein
MCAQFILKLFVGNTGLNDGKPVIGINGKDIIHLREMYDYTTSGGYGCSMKVQART